MSQTIVKQTLRLTADHSKAPAGLASVFDNGDVKHWRGNPMAVQLLLVSDGAIVDLAGYDWVKVEVFTSQAEDLTPLMSGQLANGATGWDDACTVEQWDDRTSQHATINFSAAETLLDLNGEKSAEFWMVVSAAPTASPDEPVTFGACTLTVYEDATPGEQSGAIQPGSIIPNGATYDGSGHYTVNVTAGRVYRWEKGANDTNCTNGTVVLTSNGVTTALGSTFTLNGSANQAVTATLSVGGFFTADECLALFVAKSSGSGDPNGTVYGTLGDKYFQTDVDPWREWTNTSGTRNNDKWV